ncbi:uncharacterized protein LOC115927520 [Strongylocentrotus purpuratus]|uniref:Uncharacterized protein n=1 Tax=Strongylocentrotus purpuratus TaxID=7668 RepID=A0A7M7HMN3_STRPU|nr:uncharacterized protein LOC582887 [Strongylocentrotus purpuratus]XP_030845564.1 uncharacterized protein LOC115925570 [Strongylocentrotus purpuratus]XP_030849408.1 uncharacterized protein LOC115927520 [Strongylocentrotus purpuratus]|eukprot:XP_001178139.1 PREDICTED: uncharacterized protein LOC754011 [Strongylocentrotus purpuratus]
MSSRRQVHDQQSHVKAAMKAAMKAIGSMRQMHAEEPMDLSSDNESVILGPGPVIDDEEEAAAATNLAQQIHVDLDLEPLKDRVNKCNCRIFNRRRCIKQFSVAEQESIRSMFLKNRRQRHSGGRRSIFYRTACQALQAVAIELSIKKLGKKTANSKPVVFHYRFDFAQQVHYPVDPQQPGPSYFRTQRKCHIFGMSYPMYILLISSAVNFV